MVELIIVIAMIGVLSTVLIVLIDPKFQIQRANDGKRKAQLRQIQAGLELYRSDVGGYPIDNYSGTPNSAGTTLVNPSDNTVVYLQSVPTDPSSNNPYFYCTQITCGAPMNCPVTTPQQPCGSYALYACSEQGSRDSEAKNTAPAPSSCSGGTGYYYKVLSP